jgi:hypothetical protein
MSVVPFRKREPGAVALQRLERSLLDALVPGQPKVIVGPKHDAALALHLDDRQGRPLQHPEVREGVELARDPQPLQVLVLARLGEDVDRGGHTPVNRRDSAAL